MTKEALKDLLEVVEAAIQSGDWKVDGACDPDLAIRRAREALAQEQEPVATVESVATVVSESGSQEITMSWWHEPALPVGTKLYTTPSQRKPLTVDEVWQNDELMALNAELGCGLDLLMEVVEAIEAAHGIKEKNA